MTRFLLMFATLFATSIAAASAAAALQIEVTRTTATISNVPAGGSIILFSCTRNSLARSIAVRPEARSLQDSDRDGVIVFTPAGGIPLRSVWIAVDESNGQTASGAPAGFPLRVRAIGDSSLRKDIDGELASLATDLPRLVMLLVTPGKGAWMLTGFDGQATDHDGQANGHVELSFADALTIDGADKAPKHLKKNDVVVAIDPGHLDVFLTQVEK